MICGLKANPALLLQLLLLRGYRMMPDGLLCRESTGEFFVITHQGQLRAVQ